MRNHLLRAAAGNAASGSASGHVTSNLSMHLDANSYSGSGDWLDTSTNSNNGTISGATFNSSTPKHFAFDGSDDYIDLDSSWASNVFSNTNWSVNVWFNPTNLPSSTSWTVSQNIFMGGKAVLLLLGNGSTNRLNVLMNTATTNWAVQMTNVTDLSENTWYNACLTYDPSSGYILYLNGVSEDTYANTSNLDSATEGPRIGAINSSTNRAYDGKVALTSVYEKTLTSTEVTQNWNAFKDRFGYGTGLVTSNLILHLDAENYSSGSTWTDESGQGNNGTINGTTHTSGTGAYFDFSSDYISFASLSLPNRPFTISTWCKFDDLNGWQMVAGQDQNQNTNSLGAFYFGKTIGFSLSDGRAANSFGTTIYDGTNQIHCNTPNAISANTWYNFVAVYSGSDIKMYMNNTLITTVSNSSSIATRTGTFRIGGAYFNNNFGDYFDGKIGVFQMYNSALTGVEIQQNWNTFKARYGY